MEQSLLLETMGIMVICAGFLLVLTKRLAIPSIVVFIGTGLLLGPVLGIIDLTQIEDGYDAIGTLSHLGIALLLFLVGLELSLDRVRDVGKVAVVAGIGQVVFTAVIGFGIARILGFNAMESFFLATALTFSSTVVVVKLLGQKNEIHSLHGRIAVGIFLVQDLVVIVALTFLSGLGTTGLDVSPGQLTWDLGLAFAGMGLMLVVALLASRFALEKPFRWASRRPEMVLIWSLSWCLIFVTSASALKLSPEIGAFLAGVSLAQLHFVHEIRHRLQPLMNFFVAMFFVTLGAQMQLSDASEQLFPSIVLALFVLIGNPLIFMFIISRFGYGEETSFKTSVTVAQISEFSFIFAAMGLSAGLIGEFVLAVVALVGLATIILSSYMILYSDTLYRWARRLGLLKVFKAKQEPDSEPAHHVQDHVIVVGMNSMGRTIVEDLATRGVSALAIDTDSAKLRGLSVPTQLGNVAYLAVLEEAGYTRAQLVVSTLQIEDTNTLLAYYCQQAQIPCAIHSLDTTAHDELRLLKVGFIIDSKKVGMKKLSETLRDIVAA